MDQKTLREKLKKLREENGLTQEAVEKAIGLPQKACTHIEAGSRNVSTLELAKLAELFQISIADFFNQNEYDQDLLVTLYRAAPDLKKNQKIRNEISTYIRICKEGVVLEKLLGLSQRHTILQYPFSLPKNIGEAISQGESVAREERRRLELGDGPLHNIAELLSSQGIWACSAILPQEISGLFFKHLSLRMAILVNAKHAPARSLFSYAHEYAHALFDQNRTITISRSDNSSEFVEIRANAFASAFLMPDAGISQFLLSLGKGNPSRSYLAVFNEFHEKAIDTQSRRIASLQKISPQVIALVAHHFGVSYQAALFRLQNLQYIKPQERDKLLNEESMGKEYLRILHLNDVEPSRERFIQDRELKAFVAHLSFEAYQHEKVSRGRFLELMKLLQLPAEKLLDLADSGKIA